MNRRWIFVAAAGLLAAVLAAGAGELKGRVVRVIDGDTVDVLTPENKTVRLRLWGVDCPERWQPYGAASKDYAARLCLNQNISARTAGLRWSFGRKNADVTLSNGRNLNRALVEAGFARWSPAHAPNEQDLKRLEANARRARRGLWADPANHEKGMPPP